MLIKSLVAANLSRPPIKSAIVWALSRWWARAQARAADRRMSACLRKLDDQMLRDIGVNRADLHGPALVQVGRARPSSRSDGFALLFLRK
ncbi:MAG: hypothetical protein JO366_10230 [Methylobacteriaceae bacterium]|nr:hypothetical protein [Methylobacteriaceae bacterium]